MNTPPKPQPVDLMIDIETMGNTPGAAILSIGAVFIKDGKLAEEFYQHIDLESCLENGLKMDAGTVTWWMGQTDEARDVITKGLGGRVDLVLCNFCHWVCSTVGNDLSGVQVWGNSSTFDVVLMEEAFRKTHIAIPWKFWGHRCYRTLKNLFPGVPKPDFTGIKHHALDDAKFQALHLISILEHINCLQNVFETATTDLQNKYREPQTNEQKTPVVQSPGFAPTSIEEWPPVESQDPAAGVPGTP
jgi:hypothetical protein